MKNKLTLLIGILVVIVLLAYMFMFQLRYDEVAVVSTFRNADSSNVHDEPGLYFKWFPPIQTVTRYSTLVQMMDDQLEAVATRDNHVVIVKTYLDWRIADPLAFLRSVTTVDRAKTRLGSMMRDVRGVFSRYDFNDMVHPDPTRVKLADMERDATEVLRQLVEREKLGLEILRLGIRRIVVPQQVTERVFERMTQERERLAAEATTSGEAEAKRITEEAEQIKEQILSFADRFAGSIRLEGQIEAAEYLTPLREDPELANFLRWTEALEMMLKHRTTLVLSTDHLLSPDYLLGAREHALKDSASRDRMADNQQ